MLKKDPQSWTGIVKSKQGDLIFAFIERKNENTLPGSEYVKAAQEILSYEAKAHLFNELLNQIDDV